MFVLQISDDEKRAAKVWRAGIMIIALLLVGRGAAWLAAILTLHVCSAPKPKRDGFRIFGFRLVRD